MIVCMLCGKSVNEKDGVSLAKIKFDGHDWFGARTVHRACKKKSEQQAVSLIKSSEAPAGKDR